MRTRRPSPALVVAIIAVVIATAGTAFAATGSLVTIVDPADATKTAHVDSRGKLEVGDGAGNLTVDGTTHEAAPSTFFSGHAFPASGGGCSIVAASPAGKALVIKSVSMDTWDLTVGASTYYRFSVGTSCGLGVFDVNPPSTGLLAQPFEPGIGVPANQMLWVQANGNLTGEAFAYGYTVSASAVPAAAPAPAPHQKPGAPPHD